MVGVDVGVVVGVLMGMVMGVVMVLVLAVSGLCAKVPAQHASGAND